MEKLIDEYCEKIFLTLAIHGEKIRFNELHRKLEKVGGKMSKPTLIEHLNHLIKNKIIQRDEEDKQKVTYGLNWKKFKQLQEIKKFNEITLHLIEEEKRFKSEDLDQRTNFTHIMLFISELFNLKLEILSIIEPKNKLRNKFIQTIIIKYYNYYVRWLLDSCKNSKENAQKIISFIDEYIIGLGEKFFEIPPEMNPVLLLKTNQPSDVKPYQE
jgi:DNA-binding HxlR family transcriptional regulator